MEVEVEKVEVEEEKEEKEEEEEVEGEEEEVLVEEKEEKEERRRGGGKTVWEVRESTTIQQRCDRPNIHPQEERGILNRFKSLISCSRMLTA